jgi:hypothetical protein
VIQKLGIIQTTPKRCIVRLKRDGTRAETRFRLSAKRTSPCNRRGRQFSRLLATEVCASAVVMLDTPRSEVVWEYWLSTPFASFPYTSPPVRHRVPSGFKHTLPQYLHIALTFVTTVCTGMITQYTSKCIGYCVRCGVQQMKFFLYILYISHDMLPLLHNMGKLLLFCVVCISVRTASVV